MKKNSALRGIIGGFLVAAVSAVLLAVPAGTVNVSAATASDPCLRVHCFPLD